MAVHYYNLKVVMCRERGDTKAVGSIDYSEPTRTEWVHTYTSTDVTGSAAKTEFLESLDDSLKSAPQHIKLIKPSGVGSLRGALASSATPTNDGIATSGPWSERVGKDVFRYEIGVSTSSAAIALERRDPHNLS